MNDLQPVPQAEVFTRVGYFPMPWATFFETPFPQRAIPSVGGKALGNLQLQLLAIFHCNTRQQTRSWIARLGGQKSPEVHLVMNSHFRPQKGPSPLSPESLFNTTRLPRQKMWKLSMLFVRMGPEGPRNLASPVVQREPLHFCKTLPEERGKK